MKEENLKSKYLRYLGEATFAVGALHVVEHNPNL